MKKSINARGLYIDDATRKAAEKKLEKLEKYFGDDNAAASVTFREIKNSRIAEVTISLGGTYFRAEETDSTWRNALDRAVETIERQIRKNKTRLEKRLRGQGLGLGYVEELPPDDYDEDTEFDIRTKSFTVKPMSVEEAIMQMNLLGHDFFVFRDQEDEKVCVVYVRHDNTYGLIIPD